MDPVSPIYPPEPPVYQQAPDPGPELRTDEANPGLPANSSSTAVTSPLPVHRLYSPSKHEIDTHPIVQRLSLSRDHITTGLSATRHENDDDTTAPDTALPDNLRQAEQGDEQEVKEDAMADTNNIEKGDEVSYAWGSGRPGGTVTDVAKDGDVTMETKKGNEVKKHGDSDNPALYIQRDGGHDVVKKASEVSVEEKGDGGDDKKDDDDEEKKEENGDAKTGDKRAADDDAEEEPKAKKGGAKKAKTAAEPKANGEGAKKKGRPAKAAAANGSAAKKETTKKAKASKKAATETGEPRRSGRNKA